MEVKILKSLTFQFQKILERANCKAASGTECSFLMLNETCDTVQRVDSHRFPNFLAECFFSLNPDSGDMNTMLGVG